MSSISAQHPGNSLRTLQKIIDDSAWLLPELHGPMTELLQSIREPLNTMHEANDIIHGDFYAKQILVDPVCMKLIDFDEVGRGHRLQDLGNFVGHLLWHALRTPSSLDKIDSGVAAFVQGYERHGGLIDQRLLCTSIIAGTMRCIPHAFRRGLPDWPSKVQQMLDWCRRWQKNGSLCDSRQAFLINTARDTVFQAPGPEECSDYLKIENINNLIRDSREQIDAHWKHSSVTAARLLRYKPGRRLVVEYSVTSPESPNITYLIGKVRLKKSVDSRLVRLHADLQSLRSDCVIVPKVLGVLPRANMWLQEKLHGTAIIESGNPSSHRAVGSALATLHNSSVKINQYHSIQDELQTLQLSFDRWLLPSSDWSAIGSDTLSLARHAVTQLAPVAAVLLHRDFYFDQVLIMDGSTVGLLDFDLAAMGPPECDVGNYLAHLDEYALRHPHHQMRCQRCAEEFAAGYLSKRPRLNLSNVAIWRSLSLARLAAISQRIADRTSATAAILRESHDRLSAVERKPIKSGPVMVQSR